MPASPPRAPSELPERRVAVLGFSAFERQQLETVLRLAPPRTVRCRLVADAAEAEVAIVDADDAGALAAAERHGLIDAMLRVGAGTALPRPIQVARVMRAFEPIARHGPPPSTQTRRVLDELSRFGAADAAPEPRLALVLATSDDRLLPPLAVALARAGIATLRVRTGAEAVQAAERALAAPGGPPLAVALDVRDDGAFGFLAAKLLRLRAAAAGRDAPTVLLLAGPPLAVARVRGELAGADAVLGLPLAAAELLEALPIMAACPRPATAEDRATPPASSRTAPPSTPAAAG